MATQDTTIRPFSVHIPDEDLDDLRRRILATRWPDRETVADASQGVQLATMQKLAAYWANDYDWRKAEAKLNALPNFITSIDGLDIHFIHVRSKHENATPLIVAHGWPGSDPRADEDHWPAYRSDGLWRHRGRCFPRGDPIDAGLRLLRETDRGHGRVGPEAHGARLDRADEAPGLHQVRGTGRRLGCARRRPNGRPGAPGADRHPHQPAWRRVHRTSSRRPPPAARRRPVSPTRSATGTSG